MQGFRLAFRALRRAPVFATFAILSFGIGIGANVTVFTVVNCLLLQPLPVAQPEQLVRIGRSTRGAYFGSVSYPEFIDLRASLAPALDLVGHYPNTATLVVDDEPKTIWLELVSDNYFSTLGIPPELGAGILPNATQTSAVSRTIVLSDRLWRSRFRGDPAVLGKSVPLNGHPFTVVGVAPSSFHGTFTGFEIEAWVPLSAQSLAVPAAGSVTRREDRFLMLLGRLRPGVSTVRVRAALDVAGARLRAVEQDTSAFTRLDVAAAAGVHPAVSRIVRAFLALLQGVVLLVLLVACANLATLLLVRVSARERELSVRRALGATRWRIAAVLLAESLIIATVGALLGVTLAAGAAWALPRIPLDVGIPLALDLQLDPRVLAFTLWTTAVTTLAFGIGPAFAASRMEPLGMLRAGSATAAPTKGRLRSILVGAQVALAAILLFSCGLMVRSLYRSSTLDPGFDPHAVELFTASPEQLGYDETRGRAFWESARERASHLPGVRSAALALLVPLGNRGDLLASGPVGSAPAAEPLPYNFVSTDYFATLHIPLLAGREFTRADDRSGPGAAIVSTTMARRFFGRADPIGRQVRIVDGAGRERRATVVGVVGDVKIQSLGEPARPMLYLPFQQWYRADMVLHVRADQSANLGTVGRSVIATLHTLEPNLAVDMQTMTHATAFSLIPLGVAGAVLGFAGLVGLALTSLGVFGIVAYAVSLRTREIGIRVALGAESVALARFVARHALRPVTIGLLIGLPLAVVGASLVRGMLVGVRATDPLTLSMVILVLTLSGAGALLVPLRRALAIDPARVLRDD